MKERIEKYSKTACSVVIDDEITKKFQNTSAVVVNQILFFNQLLSDGRQPAAGYTSFLCASLEVLLSVVQFNARIHTYCFFCILYTTVLVVFT